jgi:GGDEF domain-containing protein
MSAKPVDRKRSANRLASITELTRELARLVSESRRTDRPLSATCIKLDDSKSLVRRHREFAVGRLLDAAALPIVPQLKEMDVLGQTAHDELIVLLPGRSQAEANQLSKAIRFKTTNGTFNVVDRDLRARFRCETCQLLSQETAEDFLMRVRGQVLAFATN